jgi:hypothetical protein
MVQKRAWVVIFDIRVNLDNRIRQSKFFQKNLFCLRNYSLATAFEIYGDDEKVVKCASRSLSPTFLRNLPTKAPTNGHRIFDR